MSKQPIYYERPPASPEHMLLEETIGRIHPTDSIGLSDRLVVIEPPGYKVHGEQSPEFEFGLNGVKRVIELPYDVAVRPISIVEPVSKLGGALAVMGFKYFHTGEKADAVSCDDSLEIKDGKLRVATTPEDRKLSSYRSGNWPKRELRLAGTNYSRLGIVHGAQDESSPLLSPIPVLPVVTRRDGIVHRAAIATNIANSHCLPHEMIEARNVADPMDSLICLQALFDHIIRNGTVITDLE